MRFSLLKKICIFLMVLILISGCDLKKIQYSNSECIDGSTLIKYNNYIYYYNQLSNNKMGLFQYNVTTNENIELDSFAIYGDLFLIDDDLYYLCSENDKNFHVCCYDGSNIIDKGTINDNLIYASNRRVSSKKCHISLFDDILYVLYNDKIYMNSKKGKFEIVAKDILDFDVDQDTIYYSDCSGRLYIKNEFGIEAIASECDFAKIEFVDSILGNKYKITNIKKDNDYVYFIIADTGSNLGKIFRISMESKKIEQLFYEGSTCRFSISDGMLYYYDFGSDKIICINCDSNEMKTITKNKHIYGFDVFDNVIYYAEVNSDQQSLEYFKIQKGIENILFH